MKWDHEPHDLRAGCSPLLGERGRGEGLFGLRFMERDWPAAGQSFTDALEAANPAALTPALSQRERENGSQTARREGGSEGIPRFGKLFPLPWGEG
jgi:hypothetical protein